MKDIRDVAFILQHYNGDDQGIESSDVGLVLPTDRQEGPRGGYRAVATARLPYGTDKHKISPRVHCPTRLILAHQSSNSNPSFIFACLNGPPLRRRRPTNSKCVRSKTESPLPAGSWHVESSPRNYARYWRMEQRAALA